MTGVQTPRGHPVTYGSPRASIGHVVSRGIDRVSSGRAGVASVTDLTTRREPERQDLDHSPPADRRERQRPDAPSSVSGGVELSRLLVLARLTAAQALQIGADVLAAAAVEAVSGSSGPGSDEVVVGPVVAADGRVVLGPSANGGRAGSPSAAGTRMRPAGQVLADVAAAARLPGPAADPAADQRLAELDRAVQDLPAAGLPVVARRLQEAAAAIDRTAVHAELAALVRAVGGAGGSPNGVARTGQPPTAVRAGTVEPAPRRSRSAGRRIAAWLVSILVLAAVVVAEVVLLRDDITADIDMLLDAGRGEDRPSAAPEPDGPELAAPAPAAAGSVAAVDLRALAPCAPGAPCTVRLLVRLLPAAEPQVVTWSYQVVDRCTGQAVTVAGGTVTVPPQADRAAAVGSIPLPPLDGVAVFAVTDAPDAAASAPVVVGSCKPAEQGG